MREELSKYYDKKIKFKGTVAKIDLNMPRFMLTNIDITWYEHNISLLNLDHLWLYHCKADLLPEFQTYCQEVNEMMSNLTLEELDELELKTNQQLLSQEGKLLQGTAKVIKYRRRNGSYDYGLKLLYYPNINDFTPKKSNGNQAIVDRCNEALSLLNKREVSIPFDQTLIQIKTPLLEAIKIYTNAAQHEARAKKNQLRGKLTSDNLKFKSGKLSDNKGFNL